ncbi:MAG TPA: HPr(Ser) kinase/phosphatase [Candidatus Hydrogenedentes bacterium]|nr:HPr(Ser) kinase/phosphatase [Candidatus Hydrogenedentota bacterium]HQL94854.1 HPr(Ser) kinase/phosphatase [Candidatus Hydrogenedentota bacterium]
MNLKTLPVKRRQSVPVVDVFNGMERDMEFELLAGFQGMNRPVFSWDINRPGLALSGYLDYFANDRMQVLGNTEIHFMERMRPAELAARLQGMFSFEIPAFVLSRGLTPQPILMDYCNRSGIPVLRTQLSTDEVISRIILFLTQEFAPELTVHGTVVDVYGVGCLIVGAPGVGKSESALELVERGHRLVADDRVDLKRRRSDYLYAKTNAMLRHHMEIRGLGFIDIRSIYGVGSVRNFKRVSMIVQLEEWDPEAVYDRTGLEDEYEDIMGVKLPLVRIPVRPGRNIAIIIEVAALNQRLKEMGVHMARDLNEEIQRNNRR